MKKTVLIVFLAITLIFLILYAVYYFMELKKPSSLSSIITPTPTVQEEMELWTDQSEYSFKYPKSLELNSHEEDKKNYSHVELTSFENPGYLIVWVKDSVFKDTDSYLKSQKMQNPIDTNLGGFPAKKTLVSGNPPKLVTILVKDGYLYEIEVNLEDSDFWNSIYDKVSSSFQFTASEDEEKSAVSINQESVGEWEDAGAGAVSEDEEVIE